MNRGITVEEGSIGPRHDPYGQTIITVTMGTRVAQHLSNGLGMNRLDLFENDKLVGQYAYIDGCGSCDPVQQLRDKQGRLKLEIRFRMWVGISPDDAYAEFCHYPADPMGPASRYI
jgi:hypothetical protein